MDSSWQYQGHLPLKGQEQNQAQETVEPDYVHVLFPWSQIGR